MDTWDSIIEDCMDTHASIIEDCEVKGGSREERSSSQELGMNFVLMDSSFLSPVDLRIKISARSHRGFAWNCVPRLLGMCKYLLTYIKLVQKKQLSNINVSISFYDHQLSKARENLGIFHLKSI